MKTSNLVLSRQNGGRFGFFLAVTESRTLSKIVPSDYIKKNLQLSSVIVPINLSNASRSEKLNRFTWLILKIGIDNKN